MAAPGIDTERRIQALWDAYDEVVATDDRAAERAGIMVLLEEIDALPIRTAEAWRLRGRVAYQHPDYGTDPRWDAEVEVSFSNALAAGGTPFVRAYARKYLACLRYDRGRYAEAAALLAEVNPVALNRFLEARLFEMRACCAVHLGGPACATDALARYLDEITTHAPEDVTPWLLRGVLAEQIWDATVDREALRTVAARIDARSDEPGFLVAAVDADR